MSSSNSVDRAAGQRLLLQQILPIARALVEKSLAGMAGSTALNAQVSSLLAGLPEQHRVTTVVGALASAIVDLDRDIHRGVLPQSATPEDLAIQLVRLAYNRWQKDRRSTGRIQSQAARGEDRDSFGSRNAGTRQLDGIASSTISPEANAHFREVVDNLVRRLTPQDVQILVMFAEGHSQEEIAARIGCHRTTVSRKLDRFADIVRAFER